MMDQALKQHLATGLTTVCRCWSVTRKDGIVLGFTDHDRDITFDATKFAADTGMTASAIERETGLSVDNSEAIGAFSAETLEPGDIKSGRYDGAAVTCWLVNWADIAQRHVLFAGQLGEITHSGRHFRAELRGLSEPLNQLQGRQYRPNCAAILGDVSCGIDLADPVFSAPGEVQAVTADGAMDIACAQAYPDGWFQHGRLEITTGAAAGLARTIRLDQAVTGARKIMLWALSGASVTTGDQVRLVAGCDRRFDTCRVKFSNGLNFRGFPHVPGDDWIVATPRDGGTHDGGSLTG